MFDTLDEKDHRAHCIHIRAVKLIFHITWYAYDTDLGHGTLGTFCQVFARIDFVTLTFMPSYAQSK